MVWDIKIAHFDPGLDSICTVVWLSQNFEKITIYGIFGPILAKWLYIYFLEVPGHFFTENAFVERDPRGNQKATWEHPTPWGTRVMAARSFNFNGKPKGRPTKNCDFPRFLALFQFWCIFEGGTQGHPKTQGGPPKQLWHSRYGRRKFQFHWKTWGRAKQKLQFSQI